MPSPPPRSAALDRVVGLPGAVLLGLGSILGTGVFVSLGTAAGVTGPSVVLAVALAAVVATFNGLSSAQLAAAHPVSGGTYEYGYRCLSPTLGFLAGWMFLCAKSASAATAALGFSGYLLTALGVGGDGGGASLRTGVGVAFAGLTTVVVLGGLKRSNRANAVMVGLTLVGLAAFTAACAATALGVEEPRGEPLFAAERPLVGFLEATALMFVAYTGYGRVATLGEEVKEPARTIPRAVVTTLFVSMLVYVGVALGAVGAVGAGSLARATTQGAAPLEVVARTLGVPGVAPLVGLAALTAMAGVVLNLVLGLSRVVLAMARRRDLPAGLAVVDEARGSPQRAVVLVGVLIAGLAAVGSVKTTWSFSAFTVLVYYALTNLAALRLPPEHRRFGRAFSALGLVSCLALAFFVDVHIWVTGLGLLGVGLLWHLVVRRRQGRGAAP